MDNLWSPWREKYIREVDAPKDECVFCANGTNEDMRETLVIYKGKFNYINMNLYPYNSGHLMVIPYRHISSSLDLTKKESYEMTDLVQLSVKCLKNTFSPHGFNIGMNLGRIAGAGIFEHIHMHIVPRWNGDSNFMPVISSTKVISVSLESTWEALYNEINCLVSQKA